MDQLNPLTFSVNLWPALEQAFSALSLLRFWPILVVLLSGLILIYSLFYFKSDLRSRFLIPFFVFCPAMLVLVSTDHLLLLFVAWEITSLSSYFLIAFDPKDEKSRQGALQALIITGLGGLFLLAAFLGLFSITGSFSVNEILLQKSLVLGSPFLMPITLCMLLAIVTKSAQFPFHFWLPDAMTAPIPASALLHSATMVKAGIYLALLFHPLFSESWVWQNTLLWCGLVTFIWGGVCAFRTTDLKAILAQTSLAALGLIVACIGALPAESLTLVILLVLSHALYKASGFLWVGGVEKSFASRDFKILPQLKNNPWLLWTGAGLALSLIGFAPFLVFVSKEALLAELINQKLFLLIAFFSVGLIASSTLGFSFLRALFGPHKDLALISANSSTPVIIAVPLILASLHLILGAFVTPLTHALSWGEFSLWHGFNLPLALSASIAILSFVLSIRLKPFQREKFKWTGGELFTVVQRSLLKAGAYCSTWFLRARFQTNLAFLALVFSIAGWWLLWPNTDLRFSPTSLNVIALITVVFLFLFASLATFSKNKITSLLSLGGAGFMVALFFALHGAPDLALTQFCVEGLSIILLLILCRRSSEFFAAESKWTTLASHLVSLCFASFMAYASWLHLNSSTPSLLKDFFLEKSLLEGHGQNVVNVILVDFRALDTLGEISVLALSGIGVFALWSQLKQRKS